jgi:two-component system, OmpR family, alkaline phosphatase synthesis response regulator PhoP
MTTSNEIETLTPPFREDPILRRVLVVEDDAPTRVMVVTYLRRCGYLVDMASDGIEALGKIGTFRPHVMLLDLMMPNMNGWDLMKRLKSDTIRTNIIVVSAHLRVDPAEVLGLGAKALVSKPFDLPQLRTLIDAFSVGPLELGG